MNSTIALNHNLIKSHVKYDRINQLSVNDAIHKFEDLQQHGVIKMSCDFYSDVWSTTNEYDNIGMHFGFDAFNYKKYNELFPFDLTEFVLYLKTYLVSLFGRYALDSIRDLLLDIHKIIRFNPSELLECSPNITIYKPYLCGDFFSSINTNLCDEALDDLTSVMDSYADALYQSYNSRNNLKNQRPLWDMHTYFMFDSIIREYWKADLSNDERLFYYPLYIWWTLTAIIPLRPCEFLLTKRNCIVQNSDGTYNLTLRRNTLKGGKKSISYKIADDYDEDTFRIPGKYGKEIIKYLDATSSYDQNDLDTLFVADPHYHKWGHRKHTDSRFLTYTNMNTILRYFYNEIIIGQKHMEVLYDTSISLEENQIGYIHLGDTRHIALINLMQEGGTPATAMFMAYHSDTDMSSHYYSNVPKLIECKTYQEYQRLKGSNVEYKISVPSHLPPVAVSSPLSNGGTCYSAQYHDGKIADCLNTIGENGEIGYCPNCQYYRGAGISFFSGDDIYKKQIEKDCESLKTAVQAVRLSYGHVEDIGEALLKLHASSTSYQEYLLYKKQMEDTNNGKTETDIE